MCCVLSKPPSPPPILPPRVTGLRLVCSLPSDALAVRHTTQRGNTGTMLQVKVFAVDSETDTPMHTSNSDSPLIFPNLCCEIMHFSLTSQDVRKRSHGRQNMKKCSNQLALKVFKTLSESFVGLLKVFPKDPTRA